MGKKKSLSDEDKLAEKIFTYFCENGVPISNKIYKITQVPLDFQLLYLHFCCKPKFEAVT